MSLFKKEKEKKTATSIMAVPINQTMKEYRREVGL